MDWYRRKGISIDSGDSMTDIGALALIGTYPLIREHVRACQAPSGRMYRHPDILASHINCGEGNKGCNSHSCSFSRDHTIALCNYSIFSKDKEVLTKFFWHCVRHGGRMGPGSPGQSMQNPNTLASMMLSIGGMYSIPGILLALICLPFLLISSKTLPIGYKLIMVAEIALIFILTTPSIFHPLWRLVTTSVLQRQPGNLYYQVVQCIASRNPASPGMMELLSYHKAKQDKEGYDNLWLWNDPEDPSRKGTGTDVLYVEALMRIIAFL